MIGGGASLIKVARLDRVHYSWSQLIEAMDRPAHSDVMRQLSQLTGNGHPDFSPSWFGNISFDETVALARGTRRDPEVEARITQIAREQAARVVMRRASHEYAYDVTGDFFDVAAVVEGRPENWLYRENANSGFHEVVRFFVDPAMTAGVDAFQNQERIIAVAAAVLTLEACGMPVEVIAIQWHGRDGFEDGYVHTQQVNNAGEPIDLARLVALASPAYARRLHFRLVEQTCPAHANASYGGGLPLPDGYLDAEYPGACVYIPPCRGDVAPTCEALLKIVQQKLGAMGADDGGDL